MADSSHHHGSLALLPGTTSLHDYQVSIDPKVRDILTEQLLPLYNGNTHEARLHMERIMASLKLPPTTSLCRTNWIQSSSRKDLMEDIISSLLDSWDLSDTVDIVVQPHAQFADVVEIHASGKATAASAPIPLSRHSVPETSPDDTVLFANWPRRQQLGWPMTHRVIICDRFCSEAVLRGSHIFVKGILCADANIVEGECVAVYGYVGREKKKPNRGTHVMDIINNNGNNTIRPFLFLGLGKTHCPRSQLFSNETGIGVSMTLHRAGPILPPLNSIGRSHCMMQNLPSIVVGHALDPQPGDVILDMCCAPGGKTTHLASLVRGDATIVACDKSRTKIVGLLDLVKRMGAESCITPLVLDATKCVITINDENQDMTIQELLASAERKEDGLLDLAGFPPESFDRILLDPPCTALGLRPKLAVPVKAKELTKSADYQRIFLQQAVALLKPGGILTYSTCTINALENEANVAYLLQGYACMKLLPLPEGLGSSGLPGYGLDEESRTFVKRFDPADERDNCMGFFVAKLQKSKGFPAGL